MKFSRCALSKAHRIFWDKTETKRWNSL